jgi:hypothetical protein
MLHLFPETAFDARPVAYAEAVSRLASVRHALRLVANLGDGPAEDMTDADIALAWDDAGEARQRWFDRRSMDLVGRTAVGCEALLTERQDGRTPNEAASQALVEEIRRDLREVAGIILG